MHRMIHARAVSMLFISTASLIPEFFFSECCPLWPRPDSTGADRGTMSEIESTDTGNIYRHREDDMQVANYRYKDGITERAHGKEMTAPESRIMDKDRSSPMGLTLDTMLPPANIAQRTTTMRAVLTAQSVATQLVSCVAKSAALCAKEWFPCPELGGHCRQCNISL